jgi:adenosine deaminase CECR1
MRSLSVFLFISDSYATFDPSVQLATANIPYFFHAGETVTIGGNADENLLDALLLNSTRIGHGFALAHHPMLVQMVVDGGVGIEVCPISNQVLKLVDDLRDHPLVDFAARPFPATLSPDDPAIWGAVGSTHDWTMAFFALDDLAGLAMLKQLAINSLTHSALNTADKAAAISTWQASWDSYIARVAAMDV